jgi:predicted RNase H-like nuclease (RuvC/YqgF family)
MIKFPSNQSIPDPEEFKKLEKDNQQKEKTIISLNNSYQKLETTKAKEIKLLQTQKEDSAKQIDNLKSQLEQKDKEIKELKSVEPRPRIKYDP